MGYKRGSLNDRQLLQLPRFSIEIFTGLVITAGKEIPEKIFLGKHNYQYGYLLTSI
jgi:hypothetical protein